jgi:hypothetical protein
VKWVWIAVLVLVPAKAEAQHFHSFKQVVRHAGSDPFGCDIGHKGMWGRGQLRCVVWVVNRRNPRLRRETELVIPCESGWDYRQVTPPYGAAGLGQFLPGTWRSLPRRISRHSVFSPVWNVRGIRYLRLSAGRWSGPWLASRPCHHLR